MGELRKDPITGRWVIIAVERKARPHDFLTAGHRMEPSFCPFCEGNESTTPPEILALRENGSAPNGPGWKIRVVPNKFPALRIEGELLSRPVGLYDAMTGIGAHEVIIETPAHALSLTALSPPHACGVLRVYRDRLLDLRGDRRFRHALVFKNVGEAAGASLEHTHSQLIAMPVVPIRLAQEGQGARRYYEYRGRCIWCDMLGQELQEELRVVYENRSTVAFAPFASRFPFETWILPRHHASRFESSTDEVLEDLSDALLSVLQSLEIGLNTPPYNYLIHSAPFCEPDVPTGRNDFHSSFHWHVEITPRLTRVAGFEWGTGFYINPIPPEDAALFLRNMSLSGKEQP